MVEQGIMAFSYRMSGLRVESTVELPGLIPMAPSRIAADVIIHHAEVPAVLDKATGSGPTWAMSRDQFLLRVPGVARFLMQGGRDIAFEAEDGTAIEDISIFLIGAAFGILLHQREQVVLHASGVQVGGKAVLFCGPSGAGKSTLAAALGQRALPLVSDDVCAIGSDDAGAPVAHVDSRRLKLWTQSIEHLGLGERQRAPIRAKIQKYYVEPHDLIAKPVRIAAVYVLREARAPHRAGIERVNVVDAVLLIRRNAYRPRMVAAMEQKSHYFNLAAKIAASAGVFLLTRPLEFSRMPDVIESLQAHWREIGLLETAA